VHGIEQFLGEPGQLQPQTNQRFDCPTLKRLQFNSPEVRFVCKITKKMIGQFTQGTRCDDEEDSILSETAAYGANDTPREGIDTMQVLRHNAERSLQGVDALH
jgi:hypothetical protein